MKHEKNELEKNNKKIGVVKMKNERLDCKDFTNAELRAALQFYTEFMDGVKREPTPNELVTEFGCSYLRAQMLRRAASWAYAVNKKEKAQFEAKRKRAC